MMAAQLSSLEAGTTDVVDPLLDTMLRCLQALKQFMKELTVRSVKRRWNKPGDFFCSHQCTKELKTVHAKLILLYEKSIFSHKNTEPRTQIPISVKSFMASIIAIKPSLNISSSCKMK